MPAIGAALSLEWESAPVIDLAARDASKGVRRGASLRLALAAGLVLAAGWMDARRAASSRSESSSAPQVVAARSGETRMHEVEHRSLALERAVDAELRTQRLAYDWIGSWSALPESARLLSAHWSSSRGEAQIEFDLSLPRPELAADESGARIADELIAGPLAPWIQALRGGAENPESDGSGASS